MRPLNKLLLINAVFGAIGGLVSACAYVVTNLKTIDATGAIIAFIFSPISQAFLLILYTLIGFVFSKKFVAKILNE